MRQITNRCARTSGKTATRASSRAGTRIRRTRKELRQYIYLVYWMELNMLCLKGYGNVGWFGAESSRICEVFVIQCIAP
jgi:hypothetical protein